MTATTATSIAQEMIEPQHARRTVTLNHANGPFVIDIWDARQPNDVAPILLIHGWGNSGSYWASTAHALSETATVIVPDLLGTGRSMPIKQPQNMYEQVASLGNLLDELNLDRVQIVSHSMGSAMAVLLADAHPDRVERIALTGLAFFLSERQRQVYKAIMRSFSLAMAFRPNWLADVPVLPRLMAQRYFHRVPNDQRLLRQGMVDYLQLDRDTAMICADNATDDAIPDAAARLDLPVILIAGRHDSVMPVENVEFTVSAIKGCELFWIEDCGHMPMIEKSAEYMQILRGFLVL